VKVSAFSRDGIIIFSILSFFIILFTQTVYWKNFYRALRQFKAGNIAYSDLDKEMITGQAEAKAMREPTVIVN